MQMLQINQVLDGWFNKGFKGPKCKTLLKLASSRIKLLKNKREIHLKQLRRELAQLLQNGQEATARIRVEHFIREKNTMEAYESLEHFCELLIVRMPIMELQRECPIDLKEAVASLIFAAPRASDLPELQEVQTMLSFKYGREFVTSATELRPDCGVNRLVIEKLSARAPTPTVKLNVMKEIAEQQNIEWDPASTELEFSKAPQDLLDGPNQFIGPIQMSPIPCHDDDAHSQGSVSASLRQEEEFLLSSPRKPMPTASMQSESQIEEPMFVPFSVRPPNHGTEALSGRFYSPPRESSITQQSGLLEETLLERSRSRTKSEGSMDLHEIIEAAEAAAESAEKAAQAARAAAELARTRLSPKHEVLLQNDTSTCQFQGNGNMNNIHLTPDSYDWTQEYNGKQQQENDTVFYEQRVEDKGHQETLFTPNSYDWMQNSYGRKQQQDSYDWMHDSSGRKQQEDDSVAYTQKVKGKGHDYIFDDYRDKNDSAHEMPPLHHQTSLDEKDSIFTPSSRVQHGHGGGSHQPIDDVPKFDGSETATYSEPFRRQPSLADDPYYTYPNLFSKS